MTKRLFFSVGEPSGDEHTARLIHALQRQQSDVHVRGFGGPEMEKAGCQIDFRLTDLAVVGLLNVLPKLRQFFRVADQAEAVFRSGAVDAVVLVDFPGFNWHIAKRAKKYGLPVFYYLPPQLWAWGAWRIRKMRRYVDHVLTVLPFEDAWFRSRGLETSFVGHPFFDAVANHRLDDGVLNTLVAGAGCKVAVLPGSRDHEVASNWPMMLESIRSLHQKYPEAQFFVGNYRDKHCVECRRMQEEIAPEVPLKYFVGKTSEVIQAADCAMMVSGSISLELLARKTPAVVLYRVGRLFHAIAKRLVTVDSITLPNLIAGETVFPEFVSTGSKHPAVEFLNREVGKLIEDPTHRRSKREQLQHMCDEHFTQGADSRAGKAILDLLNQHSSEPLTESYRQAA